MPETEKNRELTDNEIMLGQAMLNLKQYERDLTAVNIVVSGNSTPDLLQGQKDLEKLILDTKQVIVLLQTKQ